MNVYAVTNLAARSLLPFGSHMLTGIIVTWHHQRQQRVGSPLHTSSFDIQLVRPVQQGAA